MYRRNTKALVHHKNIQKHIVKVGWNISYEVWYISHEQLNKSVQLHSLARVYTVDGHAFMLGKSFTQIQSVPKPHDLVNT